MELSFINVPTSHDELLGLLRIAYKAGQDSIEAKLIADPVDGPPAIHAKKATKYTFGAWLYRLANQWSNAQD